MGEKQERWNSGFSRMGWRCWYRWIWWVVCLLQFCLSQRFEHWALHFNLIVHFHKNDQWWEFQLEYWSYVWCLFWNGYMVCHISLPGPFQKADASNSMLRLTLSKIYLGKPYFRSAIPSLNFSCVKSTVPRICILTPIWNSGNFSLNIQYLEGLGKVRLQWC